MSKSDLRLMARSMQCGIRKNLINCYSKSRETILRHKSELSRLEFEMLMSDVDLCLTTGDARCNNSSPPGLDSMGYSDEFNLAHARNFRIPSVKFIADELRAIKQEYDMVSYRTAEGVLSVVMGPFIIKDVNFGRFEIIIDERYLGVLGNGFSEPTLKALTPNHPKSGDGREHPHISLDKYLCMGAGEDIFKSAISEVRILDALSIIESVLNTYGAEPYKPIEAWTGYFVMIVRDTMRKAI